MSVRDARAQLHGLLTPSQVRAVVELLEAYEAERIEDMLTNSTPLDEKQKVLAAREIRALLKAPKGEAGQA